MNRAEFMRRLTELLGDVSPMERDEAIQYYNDYFDDAGVENESSVIASLGTPDELARTIKAGLSDGGSGGEFTETGFCGYTQAHRDELIKAGEAGQAGRTDSAGAFHTAGDSAGQNIGWNNGTGQNGSWNNSAGQSGSRNSGMGQQGGTGEYAGGRSGAQGADSYYQGGYYQRRGSDSVYGGREDTRRHDNPYGQAGSGNAAGNTSGNVYGNPSGGQYTQPKQGMSGGNIVLIVILAVLTSPIWLGLLGGIFGVVVGLLAALFGIFIALLVVGVGLIVVSVALLVTGIALIFTVPLGGVCMVGSALIVFAFGLVFIWLMVLIAGTAIPAFVKGVGSLCRRLFGRGGVRA